MSSYDEWLESVGAEAPKVQIQELGDGQRGLFASRDIFGGERIMYVPSRALLSEGRIQIEGSRILKMLQISTDGENERSIAKEQRVAAMIEELRRLILGTDEEATASLVQITAHSMQYSWRGDDAVALYLIACRKALLSEQESEPSLLREQESLAASDVVAPSEDAEPVLVQDVIPITDKAGDENEVPDASNGETSVPGATVKEAGDSFPPFLPHVAMLPKSYPTNPLYFEEEELSRMEGTNCCEFTKRMLVQMESDWMILSAILRAYLAMDDRLVQSTDEDENLMPWDPNEDFELYKWALSTIYSRSTDFFAKQGHRRVIAPLFDMMNHDFESDVAHDMDPQGNLSVFAGSDIACGSEIFLKYGSFPNEKLLLVYGFAIHPNPYDVVQIYAPIPPIDPMYSEKAQLLKAKCGVLDPNTPYSLRRNEPIPESLLSALRLVGMQSEEELAVAAASAESSAIGAVSTENERNALVALDQALHTMARRLALSLISDENLHAASGINPIINHNTMGGTGAPAAAPSQALQSVIESATTSKADANPNTMNCKILCQSEYLILQSALTELSARIELLQNPEREVTAQ
jgi:hypothetical protein